ncbi:hypothetical protein DFH06DRAFT_1162274, partial [Mycena polygramma]
LFSGLRSGCCAQSPLSRTCIIPCPHSFAPSTAAPSLLPLSLVLEFLAMRIDGETNGGMKKFREEGRRWCQEKSAIRGMEDQRSSTYLGLLRLDPWTFRPSPLVEPDTPWIELFSCSPALDLYMNKIRSDRRGMVTAHHGSLCTLHGEFCWRFEYLGG